MREVPDKMRDGGGSRRGGDGELRGAYGGYMCNLDDGWINGLLPFSPLVVGLIMRRYIMTLKVRRWHERGGTGVSCEGTSARYRARELLVRERGL